MAELKCGCRRGESLCPEAVRLWAEVNQAYQQKNWEKYDKARKKYDAHFKEVNP